LGYNAPVMMTLALTLVVFLGFALVLAAIALLTGRVLKGSCGGATGGACVCSDQGVARGTCETDEGQGLIQIINVGVTVPETDQR